MHPRQLSILIADDHEVIRKVLRSLLSSRPEWVVCGEAVDGAEAVRLTKDQKPNVVLMDISMPGMDGVEATRIIRNNFPDTRVLIISQTEPEIARRQARAVGASGYVAKADMSRSLLGAIENLVDDFKDEPTSGVYLAPATSPSIENKIPWLAGGGEMGALMRRRDWSDSPLGPPEKWPESLKLSAGICVSSRFDLIVWWGPDLIMLYNDSYRRTLGAKHPFALGRPGRETYPEIWDVIGPMLEHVLATGEATWSENLLLFLERNGYPEETYHTFSYTPIRDSTGKVTGVITPVAETTQKVINERRLATLRDLAERSQDATNENESWQLAAIALSNNPCDLPCAVMYKVDASCSRAIAVARAGVHPQNDFFRPEVEMNGETTDILGPALREVINSGRPVELSAPVGRHFPLPAGFWRESPCELMVLPISQGGREKALGALVVGANFHKRLDDDYRGFLSLVSGQIAKSIADIRLLDEERKRSESLAELDRAKTAFFSNISHELRTPLTLILSPVEDLLARGEDIPASSSELHLVHRNVLRLLKLVNTLLDFSRIEAGRTQATYEATSLGQLTSEIASVFRSAIEKAGLIFDVDCPELDEPAFVDIEMWEKIVLNLLSNALKFTSEGKITIRLRREGESARLTVSDTGVGIPKSELPRIFERFHRVEGTSGRTHEGTGIGLALVHELVKLQSGTISVESESGVGTQFVICLPLGSAHIPRDRIVSSNEEHQPTALRTMFANEVLTWFTPDETFTAPTTLPERFSKKRILGRTPQILLVEDNADMREYVQRLLKEDGYEVDLAGDGEAALTETRKKNYDLILSDVMMPKVDGIQFLRAIRNDPSLKTTPFMLLSARAGEEFRIQGLQAGADDYLAKPFTSRELLSRVSARIESHVRSAQERVTQAQLLDMANDAAFISDLGNRISYWNRGAERLYGWTKEEAIGQNASKLLQTEFPKSYQDVLNSLEDMGVWEGELQQTTRYGHRMTVASRWTYRRDAAGNPVGWLEINSDLTLQKQAQKAALRLSARILQVQDVERRKLARELHDSLGQYLATLKINISKSLRDLGSESSRKLLSECNEVVEQCLTETRTISYLLHPPLLDETGLGSAIRWFVDGFSQRSGITVSLSIPDDIPRLSNEIETAVFRILQESLTNAHRHADTPRVEISLQVGTHVISMNVRDYGRGISSEKLRSFLERNDAVGVGLGGMRERARELGGLLTVTPAENEAGTVVSVEIPIVARESPET
jgi:PAS domain S-box-containing protein